MPSGKTLNSAIQALLTEIANEHGEVVFNGNGYTDEWHAEAEKRGLPNYKTTVDALGVLEKPETSSCSTSTRCLNPRELKSRYEIYLEQYIKTVHVEAKLASKMAKTVILPAALRYQKELADGIAASKAAGLSTSTKLGEKVASATADLDKAIGELEHAMAHEDASSPLAEAKHLRDKVLPAMLTVRGAADTLEGLVADDLWPLPTYEEMLFIR